MIQNIQNIFTEEQTYVQFLIDECKVAFNCRNVAENENYSVGSTYFVPINDTANSGLEKLAQDIFRFHVNRLGLLFNEESSGSEWWTQVIDCRDDIGFHWDRDYGLEESDGSCLYPNIATVTYLSNLGGPTIVMERAGGLTTDLDISCNLSRCLLSSPKFGKHFSFPGSLLHAAPSDLLYHPDSESSEEHASDDSSVQSSADNHPVRITFLVNVWINHIPANCSRYNPPIHSVYHDYPSSLRNLVNASTVETADDPSLSQVSIPADERERMKWTFNHGDGSYEVSMPSLTTEEAADVMDRARSNVLSLQFAGGQIEITKLESERETDDQDDDESDKGGSNDDETEEGEEDEEAKFEAPTELNNCSSDSNKRKAAEPSPQVAAKKRT